MLGGQVLLVLLVLAFSVTTIPGVRGDRRFHAGVDGWLQATAYVGTAVLVALRPLLCQVDRLLWSLVAAGLALRAAGFVVYLGYLRPRGAVTTPSLADLGWLGMCGCLVGALVVLIRSRLRAATAPLVLDGLTAALATAAFGVALLGPTLSMLVERGLLHAAVVTNLLYPAFDGLLLVLVLGVLLGYSWSPPPGVWLFATAVTGFTVVDSTYLYASVRGGFYPGSYLAGLSLISTALMALSAWAPPTRRPHPGDHLPKVVVPLLLQSGCIALLVVAGTRSVHGGAVVLAVLALLLSTFRIANTCRVAMGLLRRPATSPVPPVRSRDELFEGIVGGAMVLHYQPQVSLRTGAVTGLEALVRWQHPELGLLAPGKFLPSVEAAGLSRELTESVLGQALKQQAVWRAAGIDLPVAVNVSVSDLLDDDLVGTVRGSLARYRVPGASLVLELTEELFLRDPQRAEETIAALLRVGVRVHVDDYGTGYSSLGYLRDLPQLGGLKLDRSFVTHLNDDPRSLAIVSSTIDLARSLGVELIAEGVEDDDVRDRLTSLGCDLAQGYLFGRPVPAAEVSFLPVAVARSAHAAGERRR